MILINIKQHIRTIEFCLWYSILFIILLCRINILNGFFEIDFLKNIASIIIIINLIVWIYFLHKVNIENNQIDNLKNFYLDNALKGRKENLSKTNSLRLKNRNF